jgi:endonuclease-3 related protein
MAELSPQALRGRLFGLYGALHAHFGHEPHWWPIFSDTPQFEVLVGAVLVQQTRWESVEAAVLRLRDAGLLSPAGLAGLESARLAELVKPCAYYNQKAPGLQTICRYLLERYGGDLAPMLAQGRAALRAELLGLPRIGPETADAIMLYAGGHPVFVVDAYTRRLFGRLGIAPGFDFERARYDAVQALVETALAACGCGAGCAPNSCPSLAQEIGRFPHLDGSPRHFLWDLHALITEICIHHCLATRPRQDRPGARRTFLDPRKCAAHCLSCAGCPLRESCALYQRQRISADT